MPETDRNPVESPLVCVEPDHRLVVLARTIQASGPDAEALLSEGIANRACFGDACTGQVLYRHRRIHQGDTGSPAWSHLELSWFRERVPVDALRELVSCVPSNGVELLRAELLLSTPGSFLLPRDWQGAASRPELTASLEYIDVQPGHLRDYREVMRRWCGPAAMRLVQDRRFGTFRAMETAAVLFQSPALAMDWNQIHLCELDPRGFDGFGKAFAAAMEDAPSGGADLQDVFAQLGRIRRVPRWTFNDVVVEAVGAIGEV